MSHTEGFGKSQVNGQIQDSSKLKAFCLYISRVLIPVWDEFLTFLPDSKKIHDQYPNLKEEHLFIVEVKLKQALDIMREEINEHLYEIDNLELSRQDPLKYSNLVEKEKTKICQLRDFIVNVTQTISFVRLISKNISTFHQVMNTKLTKKLLHEFKDEVTFQ
jgi:hypothetical protein